MNGQQELFLALEALTTAVEDADQQEPQTESEDTDDKQFCLKIN